MKIQNISFTISGLFCLLLMFTLIMGCGKNNSTNPITSVLPIDDISTVPTITEIDGTDFELSAYLWRDFMPISLPDTNDHGMMSVVYISTTDSTDFPADIDADKMWVINNNRIWETILTNGSQPDNNYRIKKSAYDGPVWHTGIKVDIVVRLFDTDGDHYYIKAIGVTIHRTD